MELKDRGPKVYSHDNMNGLYNFTVSDIKQVKSYSVLQLTAVKECPISSLYINFVEICLLF